MCLRAPGSDPDSQDLADLSLPGTETLLRLNGVLAAWFYLPLVMCLHQARLLGVRVTLGHPSPQGISFLKIYFI